MNNTIKRALVGLLVAGTFTTLAGCNKGLSKAEAEKILSGVTFNWDNTEVSSDFILPAVLNYQETTKYDVTWTSNNAAVELTKRAAEKEGEDGDYLAHVVFPENETQTVTLTEKLGPATKDFTVRVNPIDVFTISGDFTFTKDKATVTSDFEVPTSHTTQGKTAEITWSIPEASTPYLALGEKKDGKQTIKVTQSALDPEIKIDATFKYKDVETTKSWRLIVSKQLTHYEEVSRWYNNAGSSIDVEGTVVQVGAAWDKSYKNMNIFVLDDDGCTGFYFYRVKAGTGVNGEEVKVGSKVKVEAAVSYAYNGLMEASATGTITALDNSNADKYNPTAAENVKAIDDLLVADTQELRRQQSRYVSLTNWKVKAVSTDDAKLLTLTKDGKDICVNMTKYYIGAYDINDSSEGSAYSKIKAKLATFKVDDYVSIKGIFSWNNAPLLSIQSENDVELGTEDTTATAGSKVTAPAASNAKKIPTSLVISDKTIEMEASTADVTMTYEVIGASNVVAANENKFVVTAAQEDKVNVKVTYTVGTFVTSDMYSIYSQKLTDKEAAEKEILNFSLKTNEFGPGEHKTDMQWKGNFLTDTNVFSYSRPEGETYDFITFAADKITVSPIAQDTQVKIQITATVGTESASKVLKATVKAPKTIADLTEFRALADGEWAEAEFTYIAGANGKDAKFLITDGKDAIYSLNKATVTTREHVKAFISKKTSYGAAVVDQIIVKEKLADTEDLSFGKTKTSYTGADIIAAVKAAKDADAALAPYIGQYIEFTGVVKDKYLNILDQAGGTDVCYTYMSEFVSQNADLIGQTVKVTGYVPGINNKANGQIQFFMLNIQLVK